jgi:hypothetical protein
MFFFASWSVTHTLYHCIHDYYCVQEWEEKLSQTNEMAETFKQKYQNLKETVQSEGSMDHARSMSYRTMEDGGGAAAYHHSNDMSSTMYGSVKSAASKAETVASGVSGLAQQARSLVMNSNFNCAGGSSNSGSPLHNNNDENETTTALEMEHESSRSAARGRRPPASQERSRSRSKNGRFREYSRSPHRVDI